MQLSPNHVNRCLTKSSDKKRQFEVMSKFLDNLKGPEFDSAKRKAGVLVRRVQLFIESNPTASQDAIQGEIAEVHTEIMDILAEFQPRGCKLGFKLGYGFGFWESHTVEDIEAEQVRPENIKERIPHIYKMRGLSHDISKMVGQGFCALSQYEICEKAGECHRSIKFSDRRNDLSKCVVFTVEVLQEN